MTGTKGYFEHNLVKFTHLLRQLGVRVSSAEVVDALAALQQVPLMDRGAVRAALRATLVKDTNNLALFEQAFKTFFAPPEQKIRHQEEHRRAIQERQEQVRQAETELTFQGRSLDLSEDDKVFYANLDPAQKTRLQEFLHKTSTGKNVEANFEPLVANLVRSHLEYWRRRMDQPRTAAGLEPTGDDEMDALLSGISNELTREQALLLYQDMKNIAEQDLPRVARVIRRLSRKLATRISRRYRRSNKVARVDLRRTIRCNLAKGGTLLELKYKQKRVQKPKLVLVCDVSGSMARYATFVLQFIYGLAGAVRSIESFVFAEELERVTPFFRLKRSFEETMSEVMQGSQVWGEGTNLLVAVTSLLEGYRHLLTSNTVVIIVSDTKTVAVEEAADRLRYLRCHVKEVIWLNTLPGAEWPKYHSVEAFRGQSLMLECNTLYHLERILRHQFLH